MEVYGVIYTIIDGTNDFEYIGQTTRSVEKRFISDKMRGKLNFTPEQKERIKNFLGVEMSVEELFKQFDD